MGKGDGGKGEKLYDYYGSIAGVVCAGPVDELIGLVVDNKMIWPGGEDWALGIDEVRSVNVRRSSNFLYVRFENPTKLITGDFFEVAGFSDSSWNFAGAVSDAIDFYEIKYASTGADFGLVSNTSGKLTKKVPITSGSVQRFRGRAYSALSNGYSTPATRPPNTLYWTPYSVLRSAQPDDDDPYAFSVEGYGSAYLYWGTATQNLDASGEALLSTNGHPAYRRQCVVVLKDFLFGRERVTAPNVEIIVRRAPNQSVVTSTPAALDADGQANPAAIAAEWLSDPVFGLGKTVLDSTTANAIAAELEDESALVYVSPVLDRAQPVRALVSDLAQYFDGWFRWADSEIEMGRFVHDETPPTFDASNTIDQHDLTEEAEWDVAAWSETSNECLVRFRDREHAFKDGGAKSTSTFNRKVTGEAKLSSLDRPWIKRRQQASDHAAEWLKVNSEVFASGSVQVRAEKATFILPGVPFRLTNDAAGVSIDCRCLEKVLLAPPSGRVEIKFQSERSYGRRRTQTTPEVTTGGVVPPPEAILRYYVVQVPPVLAGDSVYQLAVIAARTHPLTTGFRTWIQQSDVTEYFSLGETRSFAVYGQFAQNYSSGVGATAPYNDPVSPFTAPETLWLSLDAQTVQADLDRVSAEQNEDSVDHNNLLLFVVSAINPDENEIMTVRAIRFDAGVYKLKVRRKRFGTDANNYYTGDHAFLIYRSNITLLKHDIWPNYAGSTMAATLRLQAFNALAEADLTDDTLCPDIPISVDWIETPGPVMRSFTALVGDGAATTYDIVHGLGSSKIGIDVTEVSGGERVEVGTEEVDVNTTRIKFPAVISTDSYRVRISS